MTDNDKHYNPSDTEPRIYDKWEKSGAFQCDVKSSKVPFSIMMPPPNVTGNLHMGHALDNTLQDILARFYRMQGRDVLWQPGTDHAGIATQMVVEKKLLAQGLDRRAMGRDAFLKKVWEWKAESGGAITNQLRRLGVSCDWRREAFTLSDDLNKGVNKAFVQLYNEGLIYKDKRLVNWDPKMQTAVSDLEVDQREVKGNMWHFRYPLADNPNDYICIATTRPETMLGDGAVAVNPKDERYQHLVGKYVNLPLSNRKIPIIADDHADPEKGSGAVKVTAAHDFNDFAVWQRHRHQDYFKNQQDGGLINLFDAQARMNENAPAGFQGLDRYEARKKVLADMEALGLIDKIEDIKHVVPHSQRSDAVIEPWLSMQWYCNAGELAKQADKVVREGKTKIVPEQWENNYFVWMKKIEPWCISRQLWWGHQIPAWYLEDGSFVVAEDETGAQKLAQEKGQKIIARDEDVLDTWFSSAMWPFSTLGWPNKTAELARYYPTSVLITGFDIIFFWVARMMMMGCHFMGDVPFKDVYIHALVLDEKGQKMSKSKGNGIDPLDMIEKYGCDALRFTLASLTTPGRNIKLATSRIEGNRNFVTKLWNAKRFAEMNGCKWDASFNPASVQNDFNKWIIAKTKLASGNVAKLIGEYRFDLAASTAYEFFWNDFCDWYVEFIKPTLSILVIDDEGREKMQAEARATTAWVLAQALHILHPFMPFVTEEIWQDLTGIKETDSKEMLMTQTWPKFGQELEYQEAEGKVDWLIGAIKEVRSVRAELNIPANKKIPLQLLSDIGAIGAGLLPDKAIVVVLKRIAELEKVEFITNIPKGAVQITYKDATMVLPLAGVIDPAVERGRLQKKLADMWDEDKKIRSKLGNQDFVARAPEEVIEENRQRLMEVVRTILRIETALKGLS